jgi:hypothetical protein
MTPEKYKNKEAKMKWSYAWYARAYTEISTSSEFRTEHKIDLDYRVSVRKKW